MFKPTEEDIKYIKENYMDNTSLEIANILGCSASYVKKIGKTVSNGTKKCNTYHCNEKYFESIDTYEKSYWLGFLMADGCVYERKPKLNNNTQKWVKITLQCSDINHLVKFKNAIKGNHPIAIITKKDGKKYCTITIVSDIMANDLTLLGCTVRKTGTVKMPKLSTDELYWGFIQGYVDGDGSIGKCKDKNTYRYYLCAVGNYEIINDISKFFNKFNIVSMVREDKREYSFPFYELKIERMEYLKFVFDNTYLKNIIYLDRKYLRVIEYIETKYDKNKEYFNQINPSLVG